MKAYRCDVECLWNSRASLDKRTGALVSEQTDRVASLCSCLTKLIRRVKGKCLPDHRSHCEKYLLLL